ncbi:sensor histidine kinase [Pseudomonas sp. RA_35y_Pfl2_P32]|uniref:sensor histidine kinase n=1 Tax=Pseudomonas sp. RA_35y_Pfl2_P32 TaxID=3088705 RepID=UPI0030D85073
MRPSTSYYDSVHDMSLFRAEIGPSHAAQLRLLRMQCALVTAQEAVRVAERRARFAEQLMGVTSHDLRNPLAAISMAVQLLERQDLPVRQLQLLGHITHAAERAQRLIADLLDLTQRQTGRGVAVSLVAVDVQALVGECLEELRLVFPGRVLSLRCVGQGLFMADRDRLCQLLGNLVSNALDYGEGEVTVTTRVEAQVLISVHNQGAPIAPHLLDHLFEPMVRGHHERGRPGSVGLGLFIVREIARAHLGEVRVSSSVEQGTTFTATFPLASATRF